MGNIDLKDITDYIGAVTSVWIEYSQYYYLEYSPEDELLNIKQTSGNHNSDEGNIIYFNEDTDYESGMIETDFDGFYKGMGDLYSRWLTERFSVIVQDSRKAIIREILKASKLLLSSDNFSLCRELHIYYWNDEKNETDRLTRRELSELLFVDCCSFFESLISLCQNYEIDLQTLYDGDIRGLSNFGYENTTGNNKSNINRLKLAKGKNKKDIAIIFRTLLNLGYFEIKNLDEIGVFLKNNFEDFANTQVKSIVSNYLRENKEDSNRNNDDIEKLVKLIASR